MKVRHTVIALLVVASCVAPSSGAWSSASDPCFDPAFSGFRSHGCKVARLRARSFVVVAAVDSGINPYHMDFRLSAGDDMHGVHPSEFIQGFPAEMAALELSLDATDVAEARSRDAAAWTKTRGKPAWIPGTSIISAYNAFETQGEAFDDLGHGTSVASLLGGRRFGPRSEDILIVAVKEWSRALKWAAAQPSIDVISVSWSEFVPVLDESAEATRAATRDGKVSCAASGNLGVPLVFWESQGPSWNVNVGAAGQDRVMKSYSGWPNDVLGITDVEAADNLTIEDSVTFTGTSAAAPHVCGLIARTILELRRAAGDTAEGPHGGGLVTGAAGSGAMSDGIVTGREIEGAIQATAVPDEGSTFGMTRSGYGIVDDASTAHALEVLRGRAPMPARAAEDAWILGTDLARDAVYGIEAV